MTAVLNGHDLSGTTANRPTNAQSGQPYWDTDLETWVVYDEANDTWHGAGDNLLGEDAASATSAGGAVAVTGGAGGSTSGAGGAVGITGGAATAGNSAGGAVALTGGAGQGTSAGGAVTATSGAGEAGTTGTAGASGAVTITAGAAGTATTGTGGAGGAIAITGVAGGAASGAAGTGGAGSSVSITGGAGGADGQGGSGTGGVGGSVTLTAGAGGAGNTAGAPGSVSISGFGKLFGAQVIDMADAAVTLTRVPGTPTGTTLSGNVLFVDPNSMQASENLLLPHEADMSGALLIIKNTGGENIALQNDAGGAVGTIEDAEAAIVHCDGTTWRIIQFTETT